MNAGGVPPFSGHPPDGVRVHILGQVSEVNAPVRAFPLRMFGHTLTLEVKGSPAGLLGKEATSHEEREQLSLALTSLIVGAVAHDDQIREAYNKIRNAYPKADASEALARLFTYLSFTPTSVQLRVPLEKLPKQTSWEERSFEPDEGAMLSGPDMPLVPGPREEIQTAYQAFFNLYQQVDQHPNMPPQERMDALWRHLERLHRNKWKLPQIGNGRPPGFAATLRALFGALAEGAQDSPRPGQRNLVDFSRAEPPRISFSRPSDSGAGTGIQS